jgi:SNF2 family DNA or RNA helicase
MRVNKSAEYTKPEKDEASNEVLLRKAESLTGTLRSALHLQKAVLFCPLPAHFHHLKWWLTKCILDNLKIFYTYAEMGNDERTEMQLKFQDSPNPSVFVTPPKVGGTGLNLTAADYAVITQKFWLLHDQWQTFARVVQLGQNRVPHTWLLNTGPNS